MDPERDAPAAGSLPPLRSGMSRRAKLAGSLLALLALGGLGWLAWHYTRPATEASAGPGGPAGARRAPATTVGVATAEQASIPILLDALGTVTPQASVRVRPQVSGVLQKVHFKEGQMVKAGDLLATIDPRQFELALQQASGQRQRDEAQLNSARVTLERYQTLLNQDSIARQEVDSQAALVKQLEAAVVIDRANEGTARLNLSYTRVVAPITGRVGLRAVDVGNVVSPSDANGMALITQVSPIDVVFAIPQDQVGEVQQSSSAGTQMPVKALDRARARVLDSGVFASLDNQVDVSTGTVKAKARFSNSQQALFPSQFVNVQVEVRTIPNAVLVPVTALRLGAGGDYVYVLNSSDRTVSVRQVKRGPATVDKVVITSGLQAGERVITEGADRLKEGSRVVLPGDAPGNGMGRPGGRAPGAASGPGGGEAAAAAARGAASAAAAAGAVAATPAPRSAASPSPQQLQRFLDQVKNDPEALARRQALVEQIQQGNVAALERWHTMSQRRRDGGAAPAQAQ